MQAMNSNIMEDILQHGERKVAALLNKDSENLF
jgi:hypothetical protein